MIADKLCLDCGKFHIDLEEAVGAELQRGGLEKYPHRGEFYFDVECPNCGRKQGLVVDNTDGRLFTIWPRSWNDEPCCQDGCEYCEGEYV